MRQSSRSLASAPVWHSVVRSLPWPLPMVWPFSRPLTCDGSPPSRSTATSRTMPPSPPPRARPPLPRRSRTCPGLRRAPRLQVTACFLRSFSDRCPRAAYMASRGPAWCGPLDSRPTRDSTLPPMRDDEGLSIGRFARLAGLSIGALRHYDEHGLLAPASVNPETGYRSYARQQLGTARLIARLRDLDMPLPDIRAVLDEDGPRRQRRIAAHRARIEARTVRLQRMRHQLNQEAAMTTPTTPELLDSDTHRKLAAALFNHVWRLLETEDRTAAQDDEMVHAAHASAHHWSQTGVPDMRQRLAVGEWQCSRVYSVLGRAEPALHHARRCVELAEGAGLDDWVAPSAYEAMARASLVAGDRAAFEEWREKAVRGVAAIREDEDREV